MITVAGLFRAGQGPVARLALGGVLVASSGCSLFGPTTVDRRFHGKTVEGPFVSPSAYEAMVRGSVHEAKGELAEARRAYALAARAAPDLAEPLARLGAVLCRLGEDPEPSFERATSLDPELATVWMERARCALHRGQPTDGAAFAVVAMKRAPGDVATSLLVHECLVARGDPAGPELVRAQMRARWPDDPRVIALEKRVSAKPATPREALDDALRGGDDDAAERVAKAARWPLSSLALRAAAWGRLPLARRLAELVFRADPRSADARVALLVAADLQRDEAAFREALGAGSLVDAIDGHPSPLGEALLVDVVRRRTRVVLATAPQTPDDDPLVLSVWTRLRVAAEKSR